METLLLIALISTLNMVCYFIWFKIGQAVVKGEKVVLPTITPKITKQSKQSKKTARIEQEQYDAIMQNIDNYDGTGLGQIDVPKG